MENIPNKKGRNNRAYETNRIFTLNEPNAPRLNPALAVEIGLNESIIFLQLEYWIAISDNVRDGRRWTYQSAPDMKEKAFPFWSVSTINRAINSLLERKLIIIEGNYNKYKYDRTRWYAINFEEARKLTSISIRDDDSRSTQNDSRSTQNEACAAQNGATIPETKTEITTKNTTPPSAPPCGERDGVGDGYKNEVSLSDRRAEHTSYERSPETRRMAAMLRDIIGKFPNTQLERDAFDRLRSFFDDGSYSAEDCAACVRWMLRTLNHVAVTPASVERYLPTYVAKERERKLEEEFGDYLLMYDGDTEELRKQFYRERCGY